MDLINHQTKLGGLNRMLAILEELSEEITETDITDLLSWYPQTSTLQRLGILLTQFRAPEKLSARLLNFLQQSQFYPVLLSPRSNQKPGAVTNSWKVDINIQLDSDL